jgi:phosphohistidine phosphatase
MLTLILMRHAKSSWDAPQLADHDRPLNARGRSSAKAMGRWLKQHDYLPDEVLCSSSRRTVETLERLGIAARVRITRQLYHAGPAEMLAVLREALAPSVLMIGHNPGIADFAAEIVQAPPDHPRFHDYPTCATLVAGFDRIAWSAVGWGDGRVMDFTIPRELT